MEEDDTLTSRVVDDDASSSKQQQQDDDDDLSGLSARQNHSDSLSPPLKGRRPSMCAAGTTPPGNYNKYSEGFLENMTSNEIQEFTNDLGRNVTRVKKINWLLTKRDVIGKNESQQVKVEKSKSRYLQPWPIVVISIICTFLFVEMGLIILVTTSIDPYLTALNEPKFKEFDNPFEDIIEHTISFIKKWVEHEIPSDATTLLASQDVKIEPTEGNTDCIEKYFADLQTHIPTTSPKYVDLVLRNLGDHFYRSPIIRKALGDYLKEPKELQPFYGLSQSCLGDNIPFLNGVCALNDIHPYEDPFSNFSSRVATEYAVNFAAVVETLTKYISTDLQAVNEMSIAITTSRLHEMMHNVEESEYRSKGEQTFYEEKSSTMALMMEIIRNSLAENEFVSGFDATKSLQLNILEAVKLDILLGRKENALVGIALAADSYVGEYIQSFELLDRLSKEYIDVYIAWNFAFIMTSGTRAADVRIGKLFIPAVSCSSDTHTNARFLINRSISLSLSLMHIYKSPSFIESNQVDFFDMEEIAALDKFYQAVDSYNTTFTQDNDLNKKLATSLGKANLQNFLLSDPSMDTVHKMLYDLCGKYCKISLKVTDSAPTSYLNDNYFSLYLGFINWITVVLLGIGLEVFMILVYIKQKWSQEHESQWRVAQFLFSLLALMSLGLASSRNYMSLLFLVFGCWKFGFPETITPLYCAIHDVLLTKSQRSILALEAIGTLLHHSAASLVICMLVTGTLSAHRSIFEPILVLCMQHWFVLLKHFHESLYVSIEFVLETWFQWTVFSNFELYASNHWTAEVAALGMLVAHWLWLVAGGIGLFSEISKDSSKDHIDRGARVSTQMESLLGKEIEHSSHKHLLRLSHIDFLPPSESKAKVERKITALSYSSDCDC